MDGLSGSGSDWGGVGAGSLPGMARSRTLYTRSGLAMFLTCCSPRSSKEQSSLSRIWSRTTREMQIPLGSASASSRAATFHAVAEDVVFLNDHVAEIDPE